MNENEIRLKEICFTLNLAVANLYTEHIDEMTKLSDSVNTKIENLRKEITRLTKIEKNETDEIEEITFNQLKKLNHKK